MEAKQGSLNESNYKNTLIRVDVLCLVSRIFYENTYQFGRDHQMMGTFFFVAGEIKLDARIYGMYFRISPKKSFMILGWCHTMTAETGSSD